MIAAASFVAVLLLSMIVVRFATVALTLTGMTTEAARFQARSAWTGTGFATAEAEAVVNHPVRRRIISLLMVLRGAGLVTAVIALLFSFTGPEGRLGDSSWRLAVKLGIIIGGLLTVFLLTRWRTVDRAMTRLFRRILRRMGDFESRDYATLFHIGGEYDIAELAVQEGDWLAGRRLAELGLPDEGVLVLGVQKPGGVFTGVPRGGRRLEAGDILLLYGRTGVLAELDQRTNDFLGQAEHYRSAREQREISRDEQRAAEEAERRATEGRAHRAA